ncbi:hypothetical protein FACS1894195_1430 [Bacteroidia bacterium]|nr:hypothetical protein FACS1894195_1430 [Bacteroidia bacterium]
MVTFNELDKATSGGIPAEFMLKTDNFMERINVFREKCDIPMVPTSYLRTRWRQIDIYKEKAAKKQFPFEDGVYDESKVPFKSRHLYGDACDFSDKDGKLAAWVMANLVWCAQNDFYFEDPAYTRGWLHIQITPPLSGKTIFKP